MKIIDCGGQNTEAWHAARAGRVTASRVADIMRKTKTGVSAMRETYLAELIAERLGGVQEPGYCSPDMQHGKDHEANAAAMYAFLHDCELEAVDFVIHPTIDMAGCSPDRIVKGHSKIVQIKCPQTKNHIATLLGAPVAPDYIKQVQWEMACTESDICHFLSYDPRLPAEMQLHVIEIKRDNAMIAEMEAEVRRFLNEVEDKAERLRAKYLTQEAAE